MNRQVEKSKNILLQINLLQINKIHKIRKIHELTVPAKVNLLK